MSVDTPLVGTPPSGTGQLGELGSRMTVRDVIKALADFPPDAHVAFSPSLFASERRFVTEVVAVHSGKEPALPMKGVPNVALLIDRPAHSRMGVRVR